MQFRIGQGFDFHPLTSGRKLILGGVEIPNDAGLKGHSDADVAAHAIANALLGAIGEGDLGSHFPDNDPRYAGISSLKLLDEVWKIAAKKGWRIANADLTIFAQRPKLKPFVSEMKKKLASILEIDPALMNVKASSPEGLGALGRSEGMAASAVVLLTRD